jgi:hypothetical protein
MTFRKISERLSSWWRWLNRITLRDGNPMTDEMPPYSHCLNCGTELTGMYCHKCGQQASPPMPKVFQFVKDYIKNILCIDRRSLPTLTNLFFHPGHLVKDYCAGRYSSYAHPMTLHFFILFVLLTLFSITETDTKIQDAGGDFFNNELYVSDLVLSSIKDDSLYLSKIEASPRDTVKLIVPYDVADKHKHIIDVVDIVGLTDVDQPDTLLAGVPTVLIEDNILVGVDGEYHFSIETEKFEGAVILNTMVEAWGTMVSTILSHFPLMIFITVPFLAFWIRLALLRRKQKFPRTYHFMFSLFYTAYVELMIVAFYVAGIVFDFGLDTAQKILSVILFLYLTMALRQAYGIRRWILAAVAAMFINITYSLTCLILIIGISFVIVVASLI